MAYIRRTYNVPAKRGVRVRHAGHGDGVIVGSRGQCLRVRLDGENRSRTYHPTWAMEYLT